MDPKTHVLDHPLIQHKVAILRKQQTGAKEFREIVSEIAMLMCYEATRDLPLQKARVDTPLGRAQVQVLAGRCPDKRARIGIIWRGFWAGVHFAPPVRYPAPPQNAPR